MFKITENDDYYVVQLDTLSYDAHSPEDREFANEPAGKQYMFCVIRNDTITVYNHGFRAGDIDSEFTGITISEHGVIDIQQAEQTIHFLRKVVLSKKFIKYEIYRRIS